MSNNAADIVGSISWMSMPGDITIVWDEQNREKVLEIVRKKMAEGYTFFTTKRYMFKRLTRKVKVTPGNVKLLDEIIITDEQFDKMVKSMDDKDVATLVRSNAASLAKREGKKELTALERAKKPEDVVARGRDSLAIRPLHGG